MKNVLCGCRDRCDTWADVERATKWAEFAERYFVLDDDMLLAIWLEAQDALTDARTRWLNHLAAIDSRWKARRARQPASEHGRLDQAA